MLPAKSRRLLQSLLALALLPPALMSAAPLTRTDLHTGWQFREITPAQPGPPAEWRPATVPGDIHLDLLANKLIPDPFFGTNEAKLQWIDKAAWEYRTNLDATPALLRREHVDLVFEGLDSLAEVTLNGHPVLTADNAFRGWRADIKPLLRPGPNELHITFPSPLATASAIALADRYHGQTPAADKTYLRKAAYEYGWDWGPVFVTSGIWRPVHLEAWDDARIQDLHIRQRDISPALARLEAQIDVQSAAATHATLRLSYALNGHTQELRQTFDLTPGVNHLTLPLEIPRPSLWYPNGYGDQPLYTFIARFNVSNSDADEATRRTGLRSVVLRRDKDQYGRSFEFLINGIPVYSKGADVIPFDSFPSRVTTAQYRRILQSAKDANMNMIRHWGGGYYETDEFYSIADELGIMVWQDFMFGNDWQPGTYEFRQQVALEAEFQVTRLRDHPSIVLWCGNNETEESLFWERNLKVVRGLDAAGHRRIWQDYLLLFSSTLPRIVDRLDPETPYWPSSPSADYEDTLAPGEHTGDSHNWDVWHSRLPFSTYETHHERFVSEYGFQSFPEMRTIEAFTTPADRASIFTPVMLAHQKNDEGNAIIHDYLLQDYTEPKDFASFLYVSQVLQAEGIKIGAEHLRRIRPQNMGGIYWQLNDCWPVASWSSIDYFGRWKALQFYARRFYAPLLVSPHVEDGALTVYVVSDRTSSTTAQLHLRLMNFSGAVAREETRSITIPPLSSAVYLRLPLSDLSSNPSTMVAVAELTSPGQPTASNLTYLTPTKQIQLPAATITTDLEPAPGGFRLRLSSPVLARSAYVTFGNLDAEPSDNYFDLLPNQPVDLTIKTSASGENLRSNLKVISLVDALSPLIGTNPVQHQPFPK